MNLNDPTKQAEIYRYLENLKKDEDGWKKSVQTIVANQANNPEEAFLLLQVLEDFLGKRYLHANPADHQIIRNFFLHYIKQYQSNAQEPPVYLVNKMAHLFSMAFAVDFPDKWSTFFNDLFFSQNLMDRKIVFFYLKVLLAIDAEVVDRDIQRSKIESDRNVKIKDAMRDICINQIAQSWPTIMQSIEDDVIQCLVLDNIASYIDWIELDLIANDTVMGLVIHRLSKPTTSESATNAVCGLLQKGMHADKKVGLALTLVRVFRANNLLTITDESDEDDITRVGSLVNTLGLVLLDVHQK
ncbi:unnamed protein product [Caenorhabditis angaria]|uniref:Exportin-T n=1 Tax=Caenorhabditis angaria TaxID=860376 RepID=A0A9P1ISD7_9PELO|nr:unnamed protein product [Caenorhabditis angaria]